MPRQPYVPTFQHIHYEMGAMSIKKRPRFCEAIGKCIGVWSFVDSEMGCLFGQLLGSESHAAIQVFLSLRRSSAQREALQIAAKYALADDIMLAFQALMILYKSYETQRNDLAHGCFGIADKDHDIVFWVDQKDLVHFQSDSIFLESKGIIRQDRHRLLRENIFVYRLEDIENIYEDMEQMWFATFHFSGFLREPSNPMHAEQFEKLCAMPQIQQEMSRLREGRENTL